MVSLEEKEIRAKVRAEEENQKREELVNRLNEFESDVSLIVFNEHLNGALDEQVNSVIQNWTNEEFEEFIEVLEKRDKNIEVVKNL